MFVRIFSARRQFRIAEHFTNGNKKWNKNSILRNDTVCDSDMIQMVNS